MKITLELSKGKRVKMICKSGTLICGRVDGTNWPYVTIKEAYIEYSGLDFVEPWAIIHLDDIRILTPAKEIEDEKTKNINN